MGHTISALPARPLVFLSHLPLFSATLFRWTSVISNAREEALKKAFGDGDDSLVSFVVLKKILVVQVKYTRLKKCQHSLMKVRGEPERSSTFKNS